MGNIDEGYAMKFTYFEIENFRGIQKTRLDLAAIPNSHIYTLVGLNESGKSTILEAINHFTYKNESLDPLELPGYKIRDLHSLIPISLRANFNEAITVAFNLKLDAVDEEKITNYMKNTHAFVLKNKIGQILVERKIGFKDSKYDASLRKNLWTITLDGRKKNTRKDIVLTSKDKIWHETVKYIQTIMPSVLYFPNFLFEFPDKIYLEDGDETSQKSEFYRLVLQDILDATNNNLSLTKHILERAKSSDANDKRNLEGLLLDMGRNVTDVVFGAWNKIFHQNTGQKKIRINYSCDDKQKYYLEFKLEDTDGFFLINERSLGFRWFFVFLLLTQYRGFRKESPNNDVLFLFDEPASNLHPSAQAQLLETFAKLSKKCRIIYTTHSHHLINPEWLESAFVVKNEGLEYANNDLSYNANKTNVTVTRYREFAVKHPNQTDYYRPILDVLDYVPSNFDFIPDIIMVEGKNDFYVMSYMKFLIGNNELHILPGTSSSNLETPIRLYTAWGRQFLVLLDSDKEGETQKKRYKELFESMHENRIFTLLDINSAWHKGEMETLVSEEDKSKIQILIYPHEEKFNKKHFNRAIQELLIKKTTVTLSGETINNFNKLFSFLQTKLAENNGK